MLLACVVASAVLSSLLTLAPALPVSAGASSASALVVGGTAAVSDAAAAAFAEAAGSSAQRVQGGDRFETSAQLAAQFPIGSPAVVASGRTFADALAGGPAAAIGGAPVILVEPASLPEVSRAALERLQPSEITVLGGTSAVSDGVVGDLQSLTGGEVTRLEGMNRYATAAAIAGTFVSGVDLAYVASGESFPDALAGSAAAGAQGAPIVLVRPDGVPEESRAALQRLAPARIILLGGAAAVSESTAAELGEIAPVERIAGGDRYETAVAVARATWPDGAAAGYLASGETFADALAAAPVAAGAAPAFAPAGPVFLAPPHGLPGRVVTAVSEILGTPADMACGTSPLGNGTGYRPPSRPASLPQASPRPGPELLYRELATSPQLENAGPWRAPPIMVSGVRGYRSAEFVYQDFLYDDRALTYPAEPERYAGNAADIVEVRLRLLHDGLGVRLTYNSMIEPDLVAATIALGTSDQAFPLPHDAGANSEGEVFVTVHGCSGDAVRASDGGELGMVPVTTDLQRRQVDVRIPYTTYDPRTLSAFEVRAAAGLWDVAAERYLRPDGQAPAFFNVAFREPGTYAGNTWMDESQNAALAAGDISPFAAAVDVAKLSSALRDDLVDQPGGMPSSGPINRIHVSHFEPVQGRGNSEGGITGDYACEPPDCTYTYSGRLQPYTVVVPDAPPPPEGYPLAVSLHGAGENHNANEHDVLTMLAEAGRPTLVVAPSGRGPSYFWFGLAAADVYEAWADAAANYDLDPRFAIQSGQSMGGYGAYKLTSMFPDLYIAAFPSVGPGAPVAAHVPGQEALTPASADTWRMFASLRHVEVLSVNAADDPVVPLTSTMNNMQALEDLGYRYDYWFFTGGSHSDHRFLVPEAYAAIPEAHGPNDLDPRRVTYVLNAGMTEPEYGLATDHAYWLTDLTLRDEQSTTFGTVDVISHAFLFDDPDPGTAATSEGVVAGENRPYRRSSRTWGDAAPAESADALTITATNVSTATVHVERAGVTCDAAVTANTDGPLTVILQGSGCNRTWVADVDQPGHPGVTR